MCVPLAFHAFFVVSFIIFIPNNAFMLLNNIVLMNLIIHSSCYELRDVCVNR